MTYKNETYELVVKFRWFVKRGAAEYRTWFYCNEISVLIIITKCFSKLQSFQKEAVNYS